MYHDPYTRRYRRKRARSRLSNLVWSACIIIVLIILGRYLLIKCTPWMNTMGDAIR